MKRLIAALLLVSITSSSVSAAETKLPPIPEPDIGEVISPAWKDKPAPFSGVLMSPKATAKMIAELSGINARIAAEVTKTTDDLNAKHKFNMSEADAKCKREKKDLQDDIDVKSSKISSLEIEIKKKEAETPNRGLWAGIGFAGGIATTFLVILAVNKASSK